MGFRLRALSSGRKSALLIGTAALSLGGAVSASETSTYTYDALGRLITATRSGGPSDGVQIATVFDAAGNRTSHGSTSASGLSFSVAGNGPVAEGTPSVFTVTKSGTASGSLSVSYATASGSAISGSDFPATSGTLTFAASETQKTVSVTTISDGIGEGDETFSLNLSSPSSGAVLGVSSAIGTIGLTGSGSLPPTANADSAVVPKCQEITIYPLANDTDPQNALPLSLVSITTPNKGEAMIEGANAVTFYAGTTIGTAVFNYTVQNMYGLTSVGTITVGIGSGLCT